MRQIFKLEWPDTENDAIPGNSFLELQVHAAPDYLEPFKKLKQHSEYRLPDFYQFFGCFINQFHGVMVSLIRYLWVSI